MNMMLRMVIFLGDIDQGEALEELITVQEEFFKENFVSSLMLWSAITILLVPKALTRDCLGQHIYNNSE